MTAMPARDRTEIVSRCFEAYVTGDREVVEQALADDLTFFSPADPGIDRETYFARCWPNADNLDAFDFKRLQALGDDEVLVTYEAQRVDGTRFRNTEVFTFGSDDRISQVEVYFGWDL
jgi:ketosteroid isomerase-like protein